MSTSMARHDRCPAARSAAPTALEPAASRKFEAAAAPHGCHCIGAP